MGIDSTGRVGGLGIFWSKDTDFIINEYSSHHIWGTVWEGGLPSWDFCGIYGWPSNGDKGKTWELIHKICSTTTRPLIMGDDFNEILCNNEKRGGSQQHRRGMDGFRIVVWQNNLIDLGSKGNFFYVGEGSDLGHQDEGKTGSVLMPELLEREIHNH